MPQIGRDRKQFVETIKALLHKLEKTPRQFASENSLDWRWFRRVSSEGITSIERESLPRLEIIAKLARCSVPQLWHETTAESLRLPETRHRLTLERLGRLLETGEHDYLITLIKNLYDRECDLRKYYDPLRWSRLDQ